MKLKEYLNREPVKLRVIGYAKDMNTVVVHRVQAYNVVGNFYIYTTKPNRYGHFNYVPAVNYPACNYALDCHCSLQEGYSEAETVRCDGKEMSFSEAIPRCSLYPAGEESFILWMDSQVKRKEYIRLSEIRMAEEILKVMQIAGHADVKPYREHKAWLTQERERQEQESREAYKAHMRELEEAERKEHEEALEAVREALRKDGERIKVDFTLLPEVAAGLGIKIPIRTQGWIKDKLKSVSIKDGKMTMYQIPNSGKRENGSPSFCRCMDQVLKALRESAA